MGPDARDLGPPHLSPEGSLGAGVQEGEGGNSEALVVRTEWQLCPVQGYHLGSVAVTPERTPRKESHVASSGM
jgi:hypothetical protein